MNVIISMIAVLSLSSCAVQNPPQAPEFKCSPATGAALQDGVPAQITYYRDILPILSSSKDGAAYKCTTCHAHYGEPNGLNNVGEVDRIVESLETGRMPRGGDRVPKERINLIRTWQLQGFQNGQPSDKPAQLAAPAQTKCSQ